MVKKTKKVVTTKRKRNQSPTRRAISEIRLYLSCSAGLTWLAPHPG
jgi:hypothetical protein